MSKTFNSLYGILFLESNISGVPNNITKILSIPFMGFYFLNLKRDWIERVIEHITFNSLYGILFLESEKTNNTKTIRSNHFQFPLWDSIS